MSHELENLTLVIGGAASGKSDFAETLVLNSGLSPVYLATAQAFDAEMKEKISAHRDARAAVWRTIEEPLEIGRHVSTLSKGEALLLDCATLWLTNVLLGDHDMDAAIEALMLALDQAGGPIVIVTNEVGHGIVPADALSRKFRNAQGRLNRRLAERADTVVAVMAGLPLALKGVLPE
ncbi:MAG: bifunctional adenosylcobinamide kinase/adenosylcobinamide-phosphate guanylyltransferase [Brevirhabdus sp.]